MLPIYGEATIEADMGGGDKKCFSISSILLTGRDKISRKEINTNSNRKLN